jgi:serine/threonine protein phosphatase PrpC
MKEAFLKTDKLIRSGIPHWNEAVFAGCCVAACYVDESNEKIVIANSGDCRIVLGKKLRTR